MVATSQAFHWSPPLVLVQVSSLPVIVISSTSQVSSAWASVLWCNMLSTSEPKVKSQHLFTWKIRRVQTSAVRLTALNP